MGIVARAVIVARVAVGEQAVGDQAVDEQAIGDQAIGEQANDVLEIEELAIGVMENDVVQDGLPAIDALEMRRLMNDEKRMVSNESGDAVIGDASDEDDHAGVVDGVVCETAFFAVAVHYEW